MPLHTVALQLVQSNACSSPAQAETTLYVRRALGATYPMTASVHGAGAAPDAPRHAQHERQSMGGGTATGGGRSSGSTGPPAAGAARAAAAAAAAMAAARSRLARSCLSSSASMCAVMPCAGPSASRRACRSSTACLAQARLPCPPTTACAACLAHAHHQQLNQPLVAQGWKHLYRATSAAPTAASAHAQTAHIDGMAALAVVVAADVAHGPPSSFAVVIHSLRMHVSPLSPTRQRNRQSR